MGAAAIVLGAVPAWASNPPPEAVAQVLVDGTATTSATQDETDPVAVVLDGSLSADPNGAIVSWFWEIFELGADGSFVPPQDPAERTRTGAQAPYAFTTAGVKQVRLTVGDKQGSVGVATVPFFVDQHRFLEAPDTNLHANTVSGFIACKPAVNCFDFPVSVRPGIDGAAFAWINTGSLLLEGLHQELYAPGAERPDPPFGAGDEPLAEGGPFLEVAGDQLAMAGLYALRTWWTLGADVAYGIDVTLDYTPG